MKHVRRYAPFYAGVLCALVALPLALWFLPHLAIQTTANVFFIVYLTLEFLKIPKLTAAFLKKHAATADEPAWLISVVTFAAVVVAVAALFVLLGKKSDLGAFDLSLSLASVALGWMTIHTMMALHYAHLYWRPNDAAGASKKTAQPHGGLDFPGDEEPNGFDFLYFSLVTGMTAQTSDVAISKTRMRKLNLLHAVVSFFFNTVLVAAAVNVAVSLAD